MKIVFFNIAWMKHYQGITDEDQPVNGGSFVRKNHDGGEIYNFLHFDRRYYGFVMTSGSIHIERFDNTSRKQSSTDGVLVVWTASKPKTKGVFIVGWYKNATVYREQQSLTVDLEDEYLYSMCCDVKDGILLAEQDRTFEIPLASKMGKGKGKGQSNVWFAEDPLTQQDFIPRVLAYIDGWSKPSASTIYTTEELQSLYTAFQGKSEEELIAISEETTDPYEQLQLHNAICKAFPEVEYLVQRSDLLWTMGYCQEAISVLEGTLQQRKENLLIRANIAVRHMILENNKEALAGFNAVLADLDNNPAAIDFLQDEVEAAKFKAEILWMTSTIYLRQEKKKAAADCLRKLISTETDTMNIEAAKKLLEDIGYTAD